MAWEKRFEVVLAAAQEGAEWALAALYRELHPKLLRYLKAQEPGEAEDLASETWLDVASGLGRFAGDEAGFRRWLFTIARRRLFDLRRRRARQRTDPVPNEWLAGLNSSVETEAEVLSALALEAALARIATLPREQAEVVLLRVVAGFDVNDVAKIMAKRPGTVRVLQHRALERLGRQLARELVTQ